MTTELRSIEFRARDLEALGIQVCFINTDRPERIAAAQSNAALLAGAHRQAAEIARLQAQVDALADALVSAVEAMDLVEDAILGVQRKRKPDSDGWYSEQMHKDEMDRLTRAKRQGEAALNAVGR